MKQKRIAIAGVSVAMLIGAGVGVALNLPNGAGAANAPATTGGSAAADESATTDSAPPATETASTDGSSAPNGMPGGPVRQRLKDELDKLVADGTITQAQEDSILAALKAAVKAAAPNAGSNNGPGRGGHKPGKPDGPGFGGGFGGPGRGGFGLALLGIGQGLDAAAKAIGITTDELVTDLKSGQSIADVAKSKGVDPQTVIDAIVAVETSQLKSRIADIVNGTLPQWAPGGPGNGDDQSSTTTTTG